MPVSDLEVKVGFDWVTSVTLRLAVVSLEVAQSLRAFTTHQTCMATFMEDYI
jgi:hypothetical protein